MISTTLGADWINIIFEDYEYMTIRYIFVKLLSLLAIFSFVKEFDDYILYSGIIAGSDALANVFNIFHIRKYVKLRITRKCRFRAHIVPLLILFVNTLAITVYSNIDILMLGIFANDDAVGVYSVSSKMYQIIKLLINAIIVVTIPRLALLLGNENKEQYNRLLNRVLKCVIVFMLPVITGMCLLSKEGVLILGGERYIEGWTSLRILSFALIPAALNGVFLDGILVVNRKEICCLIATIASALLNILLNLFMIPLYGIEGAALTTFASELTGCLLAVFFSRDCHKLRFRIDKDYISAFIGCFAIIACCFIFSSIDNIVRRVAISIISSGLLYFLILKLFKNSIIRGITDSIVNRVKQKVR